jgi:hypothetical protein
LTVGSFEIRGPDFRGGSHIHSMPARSLAYIEPPVGNAVEDHRGRFIAIQQLEAQIVQDAATETRVEATIKQLQTTKSSNDTARR